MYNKNHYRFLVLIVLFVFILIYTLFSITKSKILLTTKFSNKEGTLQFFEDKTLNISFMYPAYLKVTANWDGGGEDPTRWWLVSLQYQDQNKNNHDYLGLEIIEHSNPNNLSVGEFYNQVKTNYNPLFTKISDFTLANSPAIIFGIPETCKSIPGFVVLIKKNGIIIEITQASITPKEEYVYNLKTILKTFSLSTGKYRGINTIPDFSYVPPPVSIECNNSLK